MEEFFIKIFRILNFSTDSSEKTDKKPIITTGSIVWGVLVRTSLIMVLSLTLIDYFDFRYNWWVILLALWFIVAYPAYMKYKEISDKADEIVSGTLCGSCRHFVKSSQLCGIYDEHISEDYIPCEGDSWEPKG
jgi:putative effector of murein hydrolase